MNYRIELRKYAENDQEITDIRLAAALHSKEEDCTALLEVKAQESRYELRLCGCLVVVEIRENRVAQPVRLFCPASAGAFFLVFSMAWPSVWRTCRQLLQFWQAAGICAAFFRQVADCKRSANP